MTMRETTGRDLGTQAWIVPSGRTPDPAHFRTPENRAAFPKPHGGLWTSTWLGPEKVSGWLEWSRGETFGDYDLAASDVWLMQPDPGARLLEIDSLVDLRRLLDRWPVAYDFGGALPPKLTPDFPVIAAHYDGIHLTEGGQWRTRYSLPIDLYGWDCESTVWLRWCFASWAQTPLAVPA